MLAAPLEAVGRREVEVDGLEIGFGGGALPSAEAWGDVGHTVGIGVVDVGLHLLHSFLRGLPGLVYPLRLGIGVCGLGGSRERREDGEERELVSYFAGEGLLDPLDCLLAPRELELTLADGGYGSVGGAPHTAYGCAGSLYEDDWYSSLDGHEERVGRECDAAPDGERGDDGGGNPSSALGGGYDEALVVAAHSGPAVEDKEVQE